MEDTVFLDILEEVVGEEEEDMMWENSVNQETIISILSEYNTLQLDRPRNTGDLESKFHSENVSNC